MTKAPAELPHYAPATRRDLKRFDLRVGLRTALSALRRHLGPLQVTRVLIRYAALSVRDPLRALPPGDWPEEREALVRHQLRSAVWIDDALRPVIADEIARHAALADVIASSGGAFIEAMLPLPDQADWFAAAQLERERFVDAATGRFFNAAITAIHAHDEALGFDVGRCRFVELCAALDRPYLAPMFCAADSLFFGKQTSPVDLERTGTLATGADQCDFRFRFREG